MYIYIYIYIYIHVYIYIYIYIYMYIYIYIIYYKFIIHIVEVIFSMKLICIVFIKDDILK